MARRLYHFIFASIFLLTHCTYGTLVRVNRRIEMKVDLCLLLLEMVSFSTAYASNRNDLKSINV